MMQGAGWRGFLCRAGEVDSVVMVGVAVWGARQGGFRGRGDI